MGALLMASLLASMRAWLGRSGDEAELPRGVEPSRTRGWFWLLGRGSGDDTQTALTDLLVALRESMDRQTQRHEELMTYLSHLPRALEMIPENTRQQSEALAAIRQHLENQRTQATQLSAILDKVGQATIDQRRILEAVRQRLDMLAENDQKVAENFGSVATALSTSNETTRLAGEVLRSLECDLRRRDETLVRLLESHRSRHTWMLGLGLALAGAALLVSAAVTVWVAFGR